MERAREIVQICFDDRYPLEKQWGWKVIHDDLIEHIALAFDRLVDEAVEETREKWHKAGFQDGLEEAAKVAENWQIEKWEDDYCDAIAQSIRKLKGQG